MAESSLAKHNEAAFLPHDVDAIEIGQIYSQAKLSIVNSVTALMLCGQRLAQKKDEIGHGDWLSWLRQQSDALGFGERTAQMLIRKSSNTKLTSDLSPQEALKVSKHLWGNGGESRVSVLTGDTEWYTPAEYIEASRRVLGGIDLDPASNDFAQQVVMATKFYSESNDGLNQEWSGRVFLNPPYKHPQVEWFVHKLVDSYVADAVTGAVLLTNNATDTNWWHTAARACNSICFTRGRISFYQRDGAKNSPTHGQTFFYFGADADVFAGEFASFGLVR